MGDGREHVLVELPGVKVGGAKALCRENCPSRGSTCKRHFVEWKCEEGVCKQDERCLLLGEFNYSKLISTQDT